MAALLEEAHGVFGFSNSLNTTNLNITTQTNGIIIVIITIMDTTDPVPTINSVTHNGVEFSEALLLQQTWLGDVFGNSRTFIYYLLDADMVNGNVPVSITFSSSIYRYAAAFFLGNAFQGAPIDFKFENNDSQIGSDGLSINIFPTDIISTIISSLGIFNSSANSENPTLLTPTNLTIVLTNNTTTSPVVSGARGAIFGIRSSAVTPPSTLISTNWETTSLGDSVICDYFIMSVEVQDDDWTPPTAGVDPTNLCAYVSQGQVREMVSTIGGLDHLENEVVQVQMDGILPTGTNEFTVASGSITLPAKAAVVHAGLPYTGVIKLLKPGDAGQGKMRRIYLATIRVFKSLAFKIGKSLTELDTMPLQPKVPALPLITGDLEKLPNNVWSKEAQLFIVQDRPLPLFILAIIYKSEIEERS